MDLVKPKMRTQEELETRLMMLERILEKHLQNEPKDLEANRGCGEPWIDNSDWDQWHDIKIAHEYSIKECRWALGLELI